MNHSIVIVGGGIGGLAAALAFAGNHEKLLVLERAAQFSEIGAGIQMGPNVTRILQSWGLENELHKLVNVPDQLKVKDTQTGKTLGQLRWGQRCLERYGAPYWTVHRADLHQVLLNKVLRSGCAELRLDCDVKLAPDTENEEAAIGLHFNQTLTNSSHSSTAQAVIGADGLWSQTREHVLALDSPKATGLMAYRALLPMARLPANLRTQDVTVWVGPDLHVVMYPVRSGEYLNVVVIVKQAPMGRLNSWNNEANWTELALAMGPVHSQLNDTLLAVEGWQRWPLFDRPPLHGPHQMAKGRIALMGDAAHPMRPFLAQGAGMAIEDAAALAACGVRTDLSVPERWQMYAHQRWARNAKVQARAIQNGKVFHLKGPMRWGRNLAMAVFGETLMDVPWLYAGP
jgi:salicylate hydroxylase